MCELSVYSVKGQKSEKVMDGVVRLTVRGERVLMEGIFGDSKEIVGRLSEVNIMAQTASIITD